MSLDEFMLADACTQIKEEYSMRAKSLGYVNFQVAYVQPSNKPGNFEENKICVMVEFYRPLFEKIEDKLKLRNLVPKQWDYNGESIKVVLDYFKLPRRVKKQLFEMKKYREKN